MTENSLPASCLITLINIGKLEVNCELKIFYNIQSKQNGYLGFLNNTKLTIDFCNLKNKHNIASETILFKQIKKRKENTLN